MNARRVSGASLSGLLSLVVLYIVLIVLVLAFASQVLRDLSIAPGGSSIVPIVLALLFPLLLLGLLVANLVRLISERRSGRPGSRFRARLLLFFLVLVLLASVPQGVLSVTFIRSAIQTWFSEETGVAIRGGQEITLSFFNRLEQDLATFATSPFTADLLDGVESRPADVWELLRGVNPSLDAIQVFGPGFAEVYAAGSADLRLQPLQAAAAREGQVARESVGGASYLRVRVNYQPGAPGVPRAQTAYTVILSSRLPDGFDSAAGRLTEALEFFVQLDRFQGEFVTAIGLFYVFFALPLVLLALLVSFLLSDEILRPIVALEDATRRVAEGDFSTRILARRGDELSMLVNSFNRMVGELARARTKIIQTEKIAAWQDIAQRLAHEVKNPLTPIRLAAERTLRKHDQGSPDFDDVLRTSVHSIINEVDNLTALLSEFREFSRLPAPRMEPVEVSTVIGEVAATYGHRPGIAIDRSGVPDGLTINADPGQLRQLVSNLLNNALDAAAAPGRFSPASAGRPAAGLVSIRADQVIRSEGRYCRIQVEDNGCGITPEIQEKIFDPYMTSKKHGTGLGLAIVQRIVFDHGGQIWFETQPDVGTTFYVDLPAAAPVSGGSE